MGLIPASTPYSGIVSQAVSAVTQAALSSALIQPNNRNIGGFVADITISERHIDRNVITEHPIETGSVSADHVYALPIKAIIHVGYSNSSLNGSAYSNYVQAVYQNFLTLKNSGQTFTVITGKRTLQNMLIEYIIELTDEKTENALFLEIGIHEAILVNTATVQASGLGLPSNNSNPASITPTAQGTQSAQPATNVNTSALSNAGVPSANINAP